VHGNPLLTTELHAPLAIRDMLINVQASDFFAKTKVTLDDAGWQHAE
jgi:hypothetical protein